MPTLSIDDRLTPRAYRITGRALGGAGAAGLVVLAVLGIGLAALGTWGAIQALEALGPQPGGERGWLPWCLIQVVVGTLCLGALGLTALGVALVAMGAICAWAPAFTTVRLDGSGLSVSNGVGPLAQTRFRFTPFEAIAELRQTHHALSLFVWQDGKADFAGVIADGLGPEDAVLLGRLLHEDLAAARAEWDNQGLVVHPRAVRSEG